MNPNLTASLQAQRNLQGEIDKQNLHEVGESLKSALPWLEQAYCLMNANRLEAKYSKLYTEICDAMTAAQEACNSIDDAPNEDSPGAIIPYEWESLLEAVNID
jgi:Iap family predicted aminopeptidase